jgi:hypothetical protein
MEVLVKAFVDDEHVEGCEYSLITIDERLAKQIASARKQLATVEQICECDLREFRLFDQSAVYFADWRLSDPPEFRPRTRSPSRNLLTDDQRTALDNEDPVVLDSPLPLYKANNEPEEEIFTPLEQERLVITDHYFRWTAFLEESTVRVYTALIAYEILNRVL